MLCIFRVAVLMLLCSLASAFARGEETYAREDERAVQLLEKAVTYYKANGEAALAAFSRQGDFVDDELYVYAVDISGVMLASGGPSANLIGRNISSSLNGELNKSFKEALSLPETGEMHSAEYHWMNWGDGKIERKRVYFQRVGDLIFAVGYYLPRSSREAAARLLNHASAEIAVAPERTIDRINKLDDDFIRDDLYVFVVDLSTQKFIAHGSNLRLIGTHFRTLISADKKLVGKKILDQLKSSDEGEVTYLWRNPANDRIEQKSTLTRRVGKYLVAVGYYERQTP